MPAFLMVYRSAYPEMVRRLHSFLTLLEAVAWMLSLILVVAVAAAALVYRQKKRRAFLRRTP